MYLHFGLFDAAKNAFRLSSATKPGSFGPNKPRLLQNDFDIGSDTDSHNLSQVTTFDTSGSDPKILAELKPRQLTADATGVSTCGYLNGDPSKPRTADSGSDCRVDTVNDIWGLCPTTVISATDCGFAGVCVDVGSCSLGCGLIEDSNATTLTCSTQGTEYCSTALLTAGPETWLNIACGNSAVTDHFLAEPTSTLTPSVSSTSGISVITRLINSIVPPSSTSSAISSSPASSPTTIKATTSPPTLSVASQSSTSSTSAATSSSPASSPTTTKTNTSSPSSPNNTGAIVGSVLGGLALVAFVVVAFLFYRRLKTPRGNKSQSDYLLWQNNGVDGELEGELPKTVPGQVYPPLELSGVNQPAELSSGRRQETIELPNDGRGFTYS